MTSLAIAFFLLNPPTAQAQPGPSVLRSIEQEIVHLVKQVEPSIVSIIAQRQIITTLNGQTYSGWDSSIGSGVVIHKDGYILTTWNVVNHADNIFISFPDGQYHRGSLVGLDPLSGIAVIRVDSVTVMPAPMGDSDDAHPGSWAIMMGNAYGLPSSVSFGLVNGIRMEDGLMQVSALVNPGASGGAVFSTDGKVIGLIAAELTPAQETGRALYNDRVSNTASSAVLVVPINRVKSYVGQLIEFGEVRRSWLGVEVEQSWLSINSGGNFINLMGTNEGLSITRVHSGSPAEQAGLHVGDRILSVNGIPMTHLLRLAEYVTSVPIGAEVEIRYRRDNQDSVAHALLIQRPELIEPADDPALLTDSPADNPPADEQPPPLAGKPINQWLMELQMEIQRLKQEHIMEQERVEEQLRNEQTRRVNTPSGP